MFIPVYTKLSVSILRYFVCSYLYDCTSCCSIVIVIWLSLDLKEVLHTTLLLKRRQRLGLPPLSLCQLLQLFLCYLNSIYELMCYISILRTERYSNSY